MKKNCFFSMMFLVFTSITLYGQHDRYVVSGRVISSDGAPLAGASVIIEKLVTGVAAGNDGHYELRGLKRGDYSLRFSFTGYQTEVRDISLAGDTEIDVVLSEAAVMAGEVVVRSTRAGNGTPLAYSNIDAGKIGKSDMSRDMPYLLSLTPSVVETSDAGTGIGYTGLRIRGSGGNRINVTLDGIPLNDAESQEMFWVDLPDLAASTSSIQVQRGVGTSTNGSGAFGASVNINSITPPEEAGAEAEFAAGSFNTFRTTAKAFTGLIGDHFSMSFRGSLIKSDGFIKYSASDIKSASVSAAWRSAKTMIKFNTLMGSERTGLAWWGVPTEMLETDRRYNPAGEYTDATGTLRYYEDETDNYLQNHYFLSFNQMLTSKLTLNTSLHLTGGKGFYEEQKSDRELAEYGISDITIGDSVITATDLVQRKWMRNWFYGAVWSLVYDGDKNDLTFGGGANKYDGDHYGRIIWMENTGSMPPDYEWYTNNGVKYDANLYSKLNSRLSPTLNSFIDLQYRYIKYTITGLDDDLRDLTQEHKFSFFNPKAGLLWRNGKGTEAYLSVAVAHREPSRSNFTDATGDQSVTPRAERMVDMEAGYSLNSASMSANVNVYLMRYHDQLVPTGELSNVGYAVMTNVDNSYRMGIELSGSYRPVSSLSLNANMTLSRNKITDFVNHFTEYNTSDWSESYILKDLGSVDIAYSPSVIASGSIEYMPVDFVTVTLTGKYVGKQYFDNTMSNDRMIDPYYLANMSVGYEQNTRYLGNINLKIMINNILNHQYESNAYGGMWAEDGVEKTWAYYFPQAGRNYMVSLAIKF